MCTLCNVHTVQFAHCAKCTIVQSAQLRRALCSIADAKNRWTWVILRLIARLDCKFGWLGNFDVKFTRHKCLMISILKTEICSNQKVQENKLPLKLNWSMNWYSQIVKLSNWYLWFLNILDINGYYHLWRLCVEQIVPSKSSIVPKYSLALYLTNLVWGKNEIHYDCNGYWIIDWQLTRTPRC